MWNHVSLFRSERMVPSRKELITTIELTRGTHKGAHMAHSDMNVSVTTITKIELLFDTPLI